MSDPIQAMHQDPALADIRRLTAGRDDGIPFLLLPVRLETRFMRVDRTVSQGGRPPVSAADLVAGLGRIEDLLNLLGGLNYALPGKPERKALYRQVDATLDELRQALAETEARHDDPMLADAAMQKDLASRIKRLEGLADELPAKVQVLKSNYLRRQVAETFARLRAERLQPVLGKLRDVTLSKMAYFGALSHAPAKTAAAKLKAALKPLATARRVAAGRYGQELEQLKNELTQWRETGPGLVLGSAEEIGVLHQARQQAAAGAKNRAQALRTLRQKTAGQEPRELQVLWQHVENDLAALPPQAKRRTLINRDFTDSAVAYPDLMRMLAEAKDQFAKWKTLRETKARLQAGKDLAALFGRAAGLAGQVRLWPQQYAETARTSARELHGAIMAVPASQPGQTLRRAADHLTQAVNRIPTDLEPAGGLHFGSLTVTVDELWVRIYPDDIAVHSHEAELTRDEAEAGQTYWKEHWLAGSDESLKKEAWLRLAGRFGQPRAAWIARSLKPKTRPLPGIGLPDKIAAALERLKKLQAMAEPAREDLEAAAEAIAGLGTITPRHKDQLRALWLKRRGAVKPGAARGTGEAAARLEHALTDLPSVDASRFDPAALPLIFPQVKLKSETWTQPPRAKVLPERFVVLTRQDGRFIHIQAGRPVPDPLILGLNPKNFTSQTFQYDEDGNLVVDPEIRWLADFGEAVQKGMGIAIPLTPEEKAKGFDQVLVLGVKDLGPDEARVRLAELFDNHHYKAKGMSLIPVGTPTNNTDQQSSGFLKQDDPDHGYAVEQGPVLFDPAETDPRRIADGSRLASGLGLPASVFQHIQHGNGLEISRALTLNRLLAPATVGYFMEEILDALFSTDVSHRTQAFFSQFVSGRGFLPSVRVGSQPYGLLVTSAFSQFKLYADEILPPLPADDAAGDPVALESLRDRRFNLLLRAGLDWLSQDWRRIAATEVKSADNIDPNAPQAHFMTQLGLEAHSLAWYQRYGVNAASRRPTPQAGQPSVNFNRQDYFGPDVFLEKLRVLLNLNDEDWKTFQPRIKRSRLYKLRYLQDQATLNGETVAPALSETDTLAAGGYLAWLAQSDPYALWNRNQMESFSSRSLLFLLARHAVLLAYRDEALNILAGEGLITEKVRRQAGTPDHFHVFSPALDHNTFATRWNYLFQGLEKLDGLFGNFFDTHAPFYQRLRTRHQSLAEYLAHPDAAEARHAAAFARLAGVKADCQALLHAPTGQLHRLLSEHLDLCTYRLDAWRLGLAHRRLSQQRARKPRGIHLGAFGWVENLRPNAVPPLAGHVSARLDPRGENPVYRDPASQGFVHAPSLNHAMTAAMLRSGYFANRRTADLKNPMAVNLTSERVRLALRLLEGVRQGLDTGILLGYQFERGLHERYQDRLELDAYIYPFRRRFPGAPAVDQPLSPQAAQSQVVNGLALLDAVRASLGSRLQPGQTLFECLTANPGLYPYGLTDQSGSLLPDAGTPELQAVLQEIDRLADALDALGDLVMTESVYQVAQGNPARAAAVVSALAEGKNPPEIEVIHTPRTGAHVTQRVVLHLPSIDARPLAGHAGLDPAVLAHNRAQAAHPLWAAIPLTPRALAEPALNRWLGDQLGDPEQIRCWAEVEGADPHATQVVSAADVGLQPLDLVLLAGGEADTGAAELNRRIADRVHRALNPDPTAKIKIHTRERSDRLLKNTSETLTPAIKTWYELAPLLRSLNHLIHHSRACAADDLRLPPETTDDDPRRVDADELRARAQEAYATVEDLLYAWLDFMRGTHHDRSLNLAQINAADVTLDEAALAGRLDEFAGQADALRAWLRQAANLGVPHAFPDSGQGHDAPTAESLVTQGQTVFGVLLGRLRAARPLLDQAAPGAFADAAKELLGQDLVILPRFTPANPAELAAMNAESARWLDQLRAQGDPLPMETWLGGLVKVRKKLADLDLVRLLARMFGRAWTEAVPGQLAWQAGDYWVGAPYPETYQPGRNTLSLVQWNAPGDTTRAHSALLVDEWTEAIPQAEEITGLTFHYNQPDATAPQSLLLAVTPEETGAWNWDHLVHTLLDTLALAKLRAVEPDQLDRTMFSQILPAVLGEVVPVDLSGDPDNPMGLQVMTDFAVNRPPEP